MQDGFDASFDAALDILAKKRMEASSDFMTEQVKLEKLFEITTDFISSFLLSQSKEVEMQRLKVQQLELDQREAIEGEWRKEGGRPLPVRILEPVRKSKKTGLNDGCYP